MRHVRVHVLWAPGHSFQPESPQSWSGSLGRANRCSIFLHGPTLTHHDASKWVKCVKWGKLILLTANGSNLHSEDTASRQPTQLGSPGHSSYSSSRPLHLESSVQISKQRGQKNRYVTCITCKNEMKCVYDECICVYIYTPYACKSQ